MVLNCTICTQMKNPETPSLLREKLGFPAYSYRGAYKHSVSLFAVNFSLCLTPNGCWIRPWIGSTLHCHCNDCDSIVALAVSSCRNDYSNCCSDWLQRGTCRNWISPFLASSCSTLCPEKVAPVYRWDGQVYKLLMSYFLRIERTKNQKNQLIFDKVIWKIKRWRFLGQSVVPFSRASLLL